MKTKIILMLLLMGSIYGVQAQTFDFSCEPEVEPLIIAGATFNWDAERTAWYSPPGYSDTVDKVWIYERGSTLNHDHMWLVDRILNGFRLNLHEDTTGYNAAEIVVINLKAR